MKLLLALAAALFVSACSPITAGFEPGTLRINIGAEPPSLDWGVTADTISFDVISNLMVGLTQYTNDLRCVPACASRWEVVDGGRTYIFHLRGDARWSDGKRLTAGDFEYAWKRLLNPGTAAQYAYFLYDVKNAFAFNTGKIKDAAQVGVKARDDSTLVVQLEKPAAYFIYLTAFCPSYPVRRDVVERWGDRWTDPEHIVTNGPFTLRAWKHEYKIELAANPLFFEGEPAVKRIKMFMVAEQSTAFALYENDQLDYIDNRSFSTSDVERYRSSPEYQNLPLLRNNYIGFNVTKSPFDNRRVRLAFSMAIDRAVFPRILRRNERPTDSWIPPPLAGWSPDSGPGYHPEKARSLLAAAGYPDGEGFPETALLYPNREDTRLVVEAIQDELKRALNIHVELVNQEWKVYLERLHRDPPAMYRNSWGADYPDPETFMNLFASHNGNNNTRWSSEKYDRIIEKAEEEQDPKRRADLYRSADHLLCAEEAPVVCTYLSTQNLMVKPWVHGLRFNALDIPFFKSVRIGSEQGRPGAVNKKSMHEAAN